jgi:hypothetical protein
MSLVRGRRQENLRRVSGISRPGNGSELPGVAMEIHLPESSSDRETSIARYTLHANFEAFPFK